METESTTSEWEQITEYFLFHAVTLPLQNFL